MSTEIIGTIFPLFCITNHLRAILIGVVRQAVNKSAGSSGFIGRSWFAEQAASWMQFFKDIGGGSSDAAIPWVLI